MRKLSRKPQNSRNASHSTARSASLGRRRVVVFLSLLAVLSLTSLLLRAMAPSPMQPDAYSTLIGFGNSDLNDAIFTNMQASVEPQRWQYVYIHHSKTAGGNALSLGHGAEGIGDHFVIGNGEGLADGELQISQRWNHQQPAQSPAGNLAVEPSCISICVVGDLDENPPTLMQVDRLAQLVQALQSRCHVPPGRVEWLSTAKPSAAGIGSHFPVAAFRDQLRSTPPVNRLAHTSIHP